MYRYQRALNHVNLGYGNFEEDEEMKLLISDVMDYFDEDGELNGAPEIFANISMYTSFYPASPLPNVSDEDSSFGNPRHCSFICVNDLSDQKYGNYIDEKPDFYSFYNPYLEKDE